MKAMVKVGWDYYIMDLDDAVVLIRTMGKMVPIESEYVSGEGSRWYIKETNTTPKISLECWSDEEYAVMKMRGKKPESTVPF